MFPVETAVLVALIVFASVRVFEVKFLTILPELNLERLLGYVFSFFAIFMGIPLNDVIQVGQLIGHKIVVNEFVAFMQFETMLQQSLLKPRSIIIVSYALCGLANFSSIAIQIGGIGGIAPSREEELADLGIRAMICGALASFQTATVAGLIFRLAEVMGIDLVMIGGG